jgi:hypothetical protein
MRHRWIGDPFATLSPPISVEHLSTEITEENIPIIHLTPAPRMHTPVSDNDHVSVPEIVSAPNMLNPPVWTSYTYICLVHS